MDSQQRRQAGTHITKLDTMGKMKRKVDFFGMWGASDVLDVVVVVYVYIYIQLLNG